MKVAAVVVTYNRKELLKEAINRLRNQTYSIDKMFIIDNASTDSTPEFLLEKNVIKELPPKKFDYAWSSIKDNIEYVRMEKNGGGAQGFYEGIKRAHEEGFDWVWLMDDDSFAKEDTLEKLISRLDDRYAAISSVVLSINDSKKLVDKLPVIKDGKFSRYKGEKVFHYLKDLKEYSKSDIYPWASFFNGVLVNKKAIDKIGYPNPKFFIWGDEVDYFFRLKKVGEVVSVLDSYVYHPDDKKVDPPVWKMYYGLRNELYINRRYRNLSTLRNAKQLIKYFFAFKKKNALNEYFRAIKDSYKL